MDKQEELSYEEKALIEKTRWEEKVRYAKLQHEAHTMTQSGECCRILQVNNSHI